MDHAPEETVTPAPEAPTTPPPADAPVASEAPKGAAYGSILSIVLIVAVLVIGAFYVWNDRLADTDAMDGELPAGTMPEGDMSADTSAEASVDATAPMPQ